MNITISNPNHNNTKTRGKSIKKSKTKSNDNLKTNIKEIRKEKNLTQDDLAGMVGVSRQTINAIENLRMSPTLILAFRITAALQQEKIEDVFIYNE
jgi:putative transcriptional regulator